MPRMVDVSTKAETRRVAVAEARVMLPKEAADALEKVSSSSSSSSSPEIYGAKGPVIATAVIAGTMATKKTSELVPFCHPLPLEDCSFDVRVVTEQDGDGDGNGDGNGDGDNNNNDDGGGGDDNTFPAQVVIRCECVTTGKTGVEMEAMTGASVAALTVYDMLKARTHGIEIAAVKLLRKEGGKSGRWEAR